MLALTGRPLLVTTVIPARALVRGAKSWGP